MKKQPSIHVTWDSLEAGLSAQGISVNLRALKEALKGKELKRFAVSMTASAAAKISLKQEDTFVLTVVNSLRDARHTAGHKGLATVTKSSPQWQQYKVIASRINAIATDYEQEPSEVVEYYCKMLIKNLGSNFNLNRAISDSTHEDILRGLSSVLEAENDPNKALTTELFEYYCKKASVPEKMQDIYHNPTNYLHFIEAAKLAASVKASGKVWIEAQFAGLAFAGKSPSIQQLSTESSLERLFSYRKTMPDTISETKSAYQLMVEKALQNKQK